MILKKEKTFQLQSPDLLHLQLFKNLYPAGIDHKVVQSSQGMLGARAWIQAGRGTRLCGKSYGPKIGHHLSKSESEQTHSPCIPFSGVSKRPGGRLEQGHSFKSIKYWLWECQANPRSYTKFCLQQGLREQCISHGENKSGFVHLAQAPI